LSDRRPGPTAPDLPLPAAAGGTPAPAPVHPAAVLAALADGDRLRCYAAAVLHGPLGEDELVELAGVAPTRVARAVRRLVAVGLLELIDGALQAPPGRWSEAARAAGRLRPLRDPTDLGADEAAAVILRRFFRDGRLTVIPTQRTKRLAVLDLLAQQFEPGRVYPEAAVNETLSGFHPDFAFLRRLLVDEDFLERRGGFYWRSGGTFEIG